MNSGGARRRRARPPARFCSSGSSRGTRARGERLPRADRDAQDDARHVARGIQGQARRALAAWKSTSATTESGLANPKEAQARKTYQTMRKQYKALQQRESEKQQAQAAQQEYDELRVADLNALKAKMDAAKESADGSAKERVVAGSIVKQKDSGAQAAYEEAARKYNLAQQIQYDERGALALGKLSEEEAGGGRHAGKEHEQGEENGHRGRGGHRRNAPQSNEGAHGRGVQRGGDRRAGELAGAPAERAEV